MANPDAVFEWHRDVGGQWFPVRRIDSLGGIDMKTYEARGYCKLTGVKKTIHVVATSRKHARTVACETLTRPVISKKEVK